MKGLQRRAGMREGDRNRVKGEGHRKGEGGIEGDGQGEGECWEECSEGGPEVGVEGEGEGEEG